MKLYLTYLFFLFIFFLSVACQQENKEVAHPNIVWIVSEDNSPLLGCYGDTFATTPVLDKFASQGIVYENAFASAPVCAPTRSTLITGVYPPSMGTQHMRSENPIPDFIQFFPHYLREAGYYCTNNSKKDYNTVDQSNAWDESSNQATYKNRKPGQPFFAIFNLTVSHESSLHTPLDTLKHDPEKVPIPAYHPRTPEMKHDWAQYYDKIETMDQQVGKILSELKEAGLADSTIVFYYSDHGGVLGRSKRFLFESGLHVPLLIRFPEKYKDLAPGKPGTRTDRLVSFLDFAPTILSLCGIDIPDYMQGEAFLGNQQKPEPEYVYNFRGRMDEVYDMSRSVRNKQFRYTRNYMPHRIYGQYLEYLWRAPSMPSWERAYKAGTLNKAQSAFWEPKPAEELYEIATDSDNVHNLADNPEYEPVLEEMRKANTAWLKKTHDSGFLPEGEMIRQAAGSTIYEFARADQYPIEAIIETANMATLGHAENLDKLIEKLDDPNGIIRYWAATGCVILGKKAKEAQPVLEKHLNDPVPDVAIATAEALYELGETKKAIPTLEKALRHSNEKVRLHALNIFRLMDQNAAQSLKSITAMTEGRDHESNDYDMRAALYLIEQLSHKP